MANSLIKSLLDSFTGGLINEVLLYVLLLLDWGLGTMYSQTCLKWKSMGLGKIFHSDRFPLKPGIHNLSSSASGIRNEYNYWG